MKRPITLCSGQFGDLSFEEVCSAAQQLGYDGLEVACAAHVDIHKVLDDDAYVREWKQTLERHDLQVWSLGAHLIGQCVGDRWDPRLDNFAPNALAGKPDEIREWAVCEMKLVARAAARLGIRTVTGFMGSPIWAFWYSFPQTTEEMIRGGFAEIKRLWDPILDEFDEQNVQFALEVHPTEIAFDYYSAQRLLAEFEYRKTLGFNFDPSHLIWQGVDPCVFLRDFSDRIYHVHMKDTKIVRDGRAGVLGSHLNFGDTRRGWNFVSVGHGDVDFESIIRELNQMKYSGPLSVEWEDSGMERMAGAADALRFCRKVNFMPSDVQFDAALKTN